MSIENLPVEKPGALRVEIPSSSEGGSSSSTSSSQASPTGILDHTPSTRTSTSSLRSQNVQFAPLPEIAPRKRKSSAPLGMAARRQLAERRRQRLIEMNGNPMWTDEEMEQQARRSSGQREYTEDDDPFLVLGKLVKDAGRQLWKKMSNKDLKSKGQNGPQESTDVPPVPAIPPTSEDGTLAESAVSSAAQASSSQDTDKDSWTVLEHTIPQTNDEVEVSEKKEDDYDPAFGTQTIVDGRAKYSWPEDKANESGADQAPATQPQKIEIPQMPFEAPRPSVQAL